MASCCGAKVVVLSTIGGGSGTGDITTANLVSTVSGLGTAGYLSSLSGDATVGQLLSTTTGIYNYVSSFIFPTELTSSLQGLATMGYVSSSQLISTVAGLNTGGGSGSSDVVYFLSSFQQQSGINLYSSNTSNNTTSNVSFVQVPYGVINPDSNFIQSFYEIFPQVNTSSIRTAAFHYVDMNSNASVRTLGWTKEFLSTPLVTVTSAYGTTCNLVIPWVQNVYTTGVDYGMWDLITSNYTHDVAAITARGIIDDRNSLVSSNYDGGVYGGGASSNFGNFITAADLDPTYPATINWYFAYDYQSGLGPEYGTVLNTDAGNINTGVVYSLGTYPPGSNPFPAYASFASTYTVTATLQPNTQYYVWWYIAYPEQMAYITSALDITYHSRI